MPREFVDERRIRRTVRTRGGRAARRWDGRTLRETLRDQTDELLRVLEEMRVAEWRRELEMLRATTSAPGVIDDAGRGSSGS